MVWTASASRPAADDVAVAQHEQPDLVGTVLAQFESLGTIVELQERLFDAATALSGSGPAFFGLVVEAFEDAAIVAGLSATVGRELALTTMVGTARMLDQGNLTCGELLRF